MTPVTAASAEVEHEEDDRDAIDRHAQIARRLLVLPSRLHPIAKTGPRQKKCAEPADDEEPQHGHFEADRAAAPPSPSLNPGGIGAMTGNPPVNAMTTPRHISMVPSVTTKEWMRNRTTSAPLTAPSAAPTATAESRRENRRQSIVAHQHDADVGGEAEHRAGGQIEVTADHQQCHADADDSEFRRH